MVALCLVAQLLGLVGFGGTMAADRGSECKKAKGGSVLAFRIEADQRPYKIGESVSIKATLTNLSKKAQVVESRSLFRYINHEKLPASEGEFGVGGQVIGDGPPAGAAGATMPVLAPGESFSETKDVAPLLGGVITEPGSYRVWLDYCYSGPKVVKGVAAPRGCTQSNEVVLIIVTR
jgi:hypothetical protein